MSNLRQMFLTLALVAYEVVLFVPSPALSQPLDDNDKISVEALDEGLMLSGTDMEADRGAQGNSVVSTQSLASTTSGNTLSVAGNLTNGNISLGNQFGGSSFGSYVMNTGNNSSLTAATAVTVQVSPPSP